MTGFVEVRFPEDISYGSSGGPSYSTEVVVAESGHEFRNVNWSSARGRYNVAHGVKTQAQLDELIAFFRARKGKAYGFRFKDWTDYQAQNQEIAVADGIKTDFQLIKTYQSGESEEIRTICKPVPASVKIYVGGIEQFTGITINSTTGVIVFDSPLDEGAIISSDFEFDVPVRFDTDALSSVIESYGVNSWSNIAIIELRV